MEHTFILRHQSPLGRYPRNGVACGSDALIVRNDFVFTATPIRNAKRYPINVSCISEFEYLRLEEIRLLGTALLSLPPDAGLICFYPATESIVATTSKANLEDFAYDQFVLRNDANGRPLVSAKTRHYSFHGEPLDHSLHRSLMRGVSLKDFLVLRGLHALLMATMLLQHREFGDAATIFLHVALEASYQLTLRKLAADGLRNPSALDAGRYIDQIFGNSSPSGIYFETFYEDRIKALHPHSRFGLFPFPPLAADDYFDLRLHLVAVFVHLITGRIWNGREYS